MTASWGINGIKQLLYGLILAIVVIAQPRGLWPFIAERLGLARRP
jgi:branched-chain amino acid transport system permease protein